METLDLKILTQQLQQARNELKNIRQQQQRLKAEMCRQVDMIKRQLTCPCKSDSANITRDHAQGKELKQEPKSIKSASNQQEIPQPIATPTLPCLKPIGWIHSMYTHKNGTPRQANVCDVGGAYLSINRELFSNPSHSLDGVNQFSHVWLLFVFHKNNNDYSGAKVRPPRMNGARVGLFSTRSPYRPNPIGLSLASVERVQDDRIYFHGGIDLLDGTPVLDIKPYIPQYDSPTTTTSSSVHCSNTGSGTRSTTHSSTIPGSDGTTSRAAVQRDDGTNSGRKSHALVESDRLRNSTSSLDTRHSTETLQLSDTNSASQSADRNTTEISQSIVDVSTKQEQNNSASQSVNDKQTSGEINRLNSDNYQLIREDLSPISSSADDLKHSSTGDVSVAEWIRNPLVPSLTVLMTERASEQLKRFKRDSVDPKFRLSHLSDSTDLCSAVRAILTSDPRSVYRRSRCSDRLYYLTVDVTRVVCWFDNVTHDWTVVEVLGVHPIAS